MSHASSVGSGGILAPYQVFPWGGGHIPPSSPFVGSGDFPSSIPNPTWGWGTSMGSGSQSASMSSTSTLFTLYGGFGSNPFTSSVVSAGGNPFQGQFVPMQGHFSLQGTSLGGTPLQGQWNPTRDVARGKPLSRSV
jgi:hypothetical protein